MIKKTFFCVLASSFLLSASPASAFSNYGGELRLGSAGSFVAALQQDLRALGYFSYPFNTDYFGSATQVAVKNFQTAKGISPDGIVSSSVAQAIGNALQIKGAAEASLKTGSQGSAVSALQQSLKTLGHFTYPQITDYYGSATADAVKAFQKANGLSATGIADIATQKAIADKLAAKNNPAPAPIPAPSLPGLKTGSQGAAVSALQQSLKTLGFFFYPQITDYYGSVTADAVKAFQKANGFSATGIADAATQKAIADKLASKNNPAPSSPALKIGSQGAAVSALQQSLKTLGHFTYPQITDYYGSVTADAVKAFQKANGLSATGIADDATQKAIADKLASKNNPAPTPSQSAPLYEKGSSGEGVSKLQQYLKALGYFKYPTVTGYYGETTAEAVKAFQSASGLSATGSADKRTASLIASKAGFPNAFQTTIILDPGHGGSDVGSIAQDGTYEKVFTLQLAFKVKSALEARGYTVAMTRTSDRDCNPNAADTSEELLCRVNFAESQKGDVFVSIHENWYGLSSVSGTETFYDNTTNGAPDKSQDLADFIHRQVVPAMGSLDRGLKAEGYYVLRNVSMPAALIEGGFISNPSDLAKAKDPGFQIAFAEAVAKGIDQFFKKYN